MNTCLGCERPESLCECCDDIAEALVQRVALDHESGGISVCYLVAVSYDRATTDGSQRVFSTSQFDKLLTDDTYVSGNFQAIAFAEFLNSDAIFDCVIPKRFLKQD